MSILEEAVNTLRSIQESCLSVPVSYRRSGGEARTVNAVVGKTVFHSRSDYGTWMRTETRDFIIRTGELDIFPETGDVIEFDGGEYEVLAPNGEPVWRWSDPHRTAMRVHTKHTGGEE